MRIKVNIEFREYSDPAGWALKTDGTYPAVLATNQPNYVERKLIFVSRQAGSELLLSKGEYEVVLSDDELSPNTNKDFLEGLRCPHCHETGPFDFEGKAKFRLKDTEVVHTHELDWDHLTPMTCCGCGYKGVQWQFNELNPYWYVREGDLTTQTKSLKQLFKFQQQYNENTQTRILDEVLLQHVVSLFDKFKQHKHKYKIRFNHGMGLTDVFCDAPAPHHRRYIDAINGPSGEKRKRLENRWPELFELIELCDMIEEHFGLTVGVLE